MAATRCLQPVTVLISRGAPARPGQRPGVLQGCELLLKSVVQLRVIGPDLTEQELQSFNGHALDVVLPRGVKQHDRRAQKRAGVTRWPTTGALGRGMQRIKFWTSWIKES